MAIAWGKALSNALAIIMCSPMNVSVIKEKHCRCESKVAAIMLSALTVLTFNVAIYTWGVAPPDNYRGLLPVAPSELLYVLYHQYFQIE